MTRTGKCVYVVFGKVMSYWVKVVIASLAIVSLNLVEDYFLKSFGSLETSGMDEMCRLTPDC